MSADVTVASRRINADHIWLGLILTLVLLPACSPERLVLFSVRPRPGVGDDVVISSLEVRTSLTHYTPEPPQNTANDGGNTTFPKTVGVYVHARSGRMTVAVYAYAPGGNLVAAGQGDVMLNDEREQTIEQDVILVPCIGQPLPPPDLCMMPQPPDGGDAGTGVDAGTDAKDAGDASIVDTHPEVSDDSSGDEPPETLDASPDERPEVVDVAPEQHAGDVPVDTGVGQTDANDAENASPEAGPDVADGADTGSDVAIPGPDPGPIPSDCVNYCTQVSAVCPSDFPGERECEANCTFSQLASQDGVLACRIGRANLVCAQASLLSSRCDPPLCDLYCALGASVCGQTLFPSDFCLSDQGCPALERGEIASDISGDTLACRAHWLERVVDDLRFCDWSSLAPTAGPCRPQ